LVKSLREGLKRKAHSKRGLNLAWGFFTN